MSLKKLFSIHKPAKSIEAATFEDIAEDAESAEYVKSFFIDREKHTPEIDYSDPKNFAQFGLAKEYYEHSFDYIRQTYPYDGSLYEKLDWQNSGSNLDNYVFDNLYPRSTGHAIFSPAGWGSNVGSKDSVSAYGLSDTQEYIVVKSGPNTGSSDWKAGLNNIYKAAANREDNLKFDLDSGITVEFWLKKEAYASSNTSQEVIFDMWNGAVSSSADYGRLRIELTGTVESDESNEATFLLTAMSGTSGFFQEKIGASYVTTTTVADNSWKHYAVTFKNHDGQINSEIYVNGTQKHSIVTGSSFSRVYPVSGTIGYIGALRTAPSGTTEQGGTSTTGWGKLSGSIDEFRYWKTARTPKQIGRHWFTQVAGGTNTDLSNTDLGVYYKFNEGITGTSSVDSVVTDYSGRLSNGTWTGYGSTSRNTDSAIVSAGYTEFKDPIIRSENSNYTDKRTEMANSGSEWDNNNVSSLYSYFPDWITEEEVKHGSDNLRNFTQIISSYLDELNSYIKDLPRLRDVSYLSGSSYKPAPFKQQALNSYGFNTYDLFKNADIIEQLMQKDETQNYEEKLHNVRNFIYSNIYNNLTSIYKSKGTDRSLRHLLNCFGIDEDIFKINLYADNLTYTLKDEKYSTPVKTKLLDFSREENFQGVVYQYTSSTDSNSVSYISGAADESVPFTVETSILFPKKADSWQQPFEVYTGITSSLFGMHTANPNDAADTTFYSWDPGHFNVYASRIDKDLTKKVKFVLTSSNSGVIPLLTSSAFEDVYENSKWNFAVSIKPKSQVSNTTDDSDTKDYIVEFRGYNSELDIVNNYFSVTGTVGRERISHFLTSSKRLYLGTHYTNFTSSSPNERSDVRVLSSRVWMDYLPDEALKHHSFDIDSYGPLNPMRNAYLNNTGTIGQQVHEIDTLALHWEFDTVTGSNSSGEFLVLDTSEASSDSATKYGWVGEITKKSHPGQAKSFGASSTNVFDVDYIPTAKQRLPEIMNSVDMVSVLNTEDDDLFMRSSRPIKYLLSIEKSMYQSISEEMLNMFASVQEYHDLIGAAVNKYRPEYKSMEKLRNVFFRRINNIPDVEKYVNFYKWFDNSVVLMLKQMVPISARQMNYHGDMIESHILERNKYHHKFPTLESKQPDIEGPVFGINELTYNWKFGHPEPPVAWSTKAINFQSAGSKNDSLTLTVADGNALSFSDGSSDTPMSISFWVNFNAFDGNQYIFNKKGVLAGRGDWNVRIASTLTLVFQIKDKSNSSNYIQRFITRANLGMTDTGTWYHMLLTYDGSGTSSGLKIYLNGTEKTHLGTGQDISYTSTGLAASLHIGNQTAADASGAGLNAKMDEIAFYNAALTGTIPSALYNSGVPMDLRNEHRSTNSLVHWLRLGDASGDSIGDDYSDTTTIIDVVGATTVSASNITSVDSTDGVSTAKEHYNDKLSCLWWKERAGRTIGRISSRDSNADSDRDVILRTATTHVTGSKTTIAKQDGTTYTANTYAERRLSRPYKFSVQRQELNKSINKKAQAYKTIKEDSFFNVSASSIGSLLNCDDAPTPEELKKEKLDFTVVDTGDGVDGSYLEGKGNFLAPFNVYTSSVSSGYSQDLNIISASSNIEINDIHQDIYGSGDPLNKPMQGVFTEKYVGGNFHRHVDLNTNVTDDEDSRREGWRVEYDGDNLKINKRIPFSHNQKSQPPYNRVFREEYAKRPVNIKNIKHTGSSPTKIGNYEHKYQVFSTSGRDVNNLWFRSGSAGAGGVTLETSASTYVSGVLDYSLESKSTLEDGSRNKSVFASRFSAPGGPETLSRGAVDQESETYSVYNSLNYRNLIARNALNTFLRTSSGQFGVQSGSVVRSSDYLIEHTASYHKTHRNTAYRITQKDNLFAKYWTKFGNSNGEGVQLYNHANHSFGADGTTGNEPSFSISAWFDLPENLDDGVRVLVSKRKEYQLGIRVDNTGGDCSIDFRLYDNDLTKYLYSNTNANAALTASTGPTHVVATYDGSRDEDNIKLYANGTELTYISQQNFNSYVAMHATGLDVFLGCTAGDTNVPNGNYYDGWLGEVSIWSKELTVADITSIYNSGCPNNLSDHVSASSNLVSWVRLNENENYTQVSGVIDQTGLSAARGAGAPSFATMDNTNIEKIPYNAGCVNKNVIHTSSTNDNYFVTHQIPRADRQYSWITASLASHGIGDSAPLTFPNRLDGKVSSSSGHVNAIQFLSESEHGSYNWNPTSKGVSFNNLNNYRDFGKHKNESHAGDQPATELIVTDFAGMNTNVYEEINTDTNTLGFDSSFTIGGWGSQYFYELGFLSNPSAYFNHWGRYRTPNLAIAFNNNPFGSTMVPPGGMAGLNVAYLSMINPAMTVTSSDNRSAGLNAVINNRQGPYGWPSWKQIRGAQHPIARDMVKNNRYSVSELTASSDTKSLILSGKSLSNNTALRILNFIEPPVVSRYKPMEHVLNVVSSEAEEPQNTTLVYTHNNNLVTMEVRPELPNRDLVSKLNFIENEEASLYNDIKLYYGVGENFDNKIPSELNPLVSSQTNYNIPGYTDKMQGTDNRGMISFKYRDTIYPKQRYTYLNKIRTRDQYFVTFWRNNRISERYVEIANDLSGTVRERVEGRTIFSAGITDGRSATGNAGTSSVIGYETTPTVWKADMARLHTVYVTNSQGQIITDVGFAVIGGASDNVYPSAHTKPSIWPLDARAVFDTGSTLHEAGNWFSTLNTTIWENINISAVDTKIQGGYSGYDGAGELQNDYCIYHNGNLYQSASLSGTVVAGQYGAGAGTTPDDLSPGVRSAGLRPAALYNRRIPELVTDHRRSVVVYSGDTLWEAGDQAGKYPMTDSYAAWYEHLRAAAKDYTIVPEYRMSEYIEQYLTSSDTKFKNFGDVFSKWLTLTGASIPDNDKAAHIVTDVRHLDDDFYHVYSTTEFLKDFTEIKKEHSAKNFNPVNLKLTCRVAKKFLPYDGFYPAQRALQMAQIFSQSYGPTVSYRGTQPSFRTALTPFFAPGILFNTIKSGLAVDYPINTSHVTITGSTVNSTKDHGIPRIKSNYSERVPFEALANPSLLAGKFIVDPEPHPSASINCTASLSTPKDLRYNRAIENFLAEIPNFFLEASDPSYGYYGDRPGGLIGFKSHPVPLQATAGSVPLFQVTNIPTSQTIIKEYRMRLRIYNGTVRSREDINTLRGDVTDSIRGASWPSKEFNTPGVTMYDRYSNVAASTVQGDFDLYNNYGSSFGPPVDSPRTTYNSNTLHYSDLSTTTTASFEPYTPPYYNGYADYDIVLKAPFEEKNATIAAEDFLKYITVEERGVFTRVGNNLFASGSAAANAMNLSASVKIELVQDPNDQINNPSLYIRTKFETPVLDFSNASVTAPATGSAGIARGMWHQYGQAPDPDKGIFMELIPWNDNLTNDLSGTVANTGSLYEVCGFDLPGEFPPNPDKLGGSNIFGGVGKKQVGQVAKEKVIREAVVAIPFQEVAGKRVFYEIPDRVVRLVKAKYFPELTTETVTDVQAEFPDLFKFDFNWYDYKKMIEKMRKYVFPPNFDFISNPSAKKAIMYIFEFEHKFDQKDLSDMWQNLPPDSLNRVIGDNPFQKDKAYDTAVDEWSHNLFVDNFFGIVGHDNSAVYGDLGAKINSKNGDSHLKTKWLVFKVKQKAKKSFKDITSFTKEESFPYSYNWPYDYFSMIEMAKMEAEVEFGAIKDKYNPLQHVEWGATQMSNEQKAPPGEVLFAGGAGMQSAPGGAGSPKGPGAPQQAAPAQKSSQKSKQKSTQKKSKAQQREEVKRSGKGTARQNSRTTTETNKKEIKPAGGKTNLGIGGYGGFGGKKKP